MRDKKIVLNWDMDCHTHTSYSDCCEDVTIEKLKKKAGEIDLDFAVTDHSAHLYFPREIVWCMMTEAFPMLFEFYRTEGRRNIEKYITTLRKNGVTVGLELDIYTDETLVFEDDLFQELDIVVGSLHVLDALQRKKECATVVDEFKRLTLALLASNRIDILGHPFRILSRAGIRIENELIQWVVDQCGIYDVALEINSHYKYPDIDVKMAEMAFRHDVPLVKASDAHAMREFGDYEYHSEVMRGVSKTLKPPLSTTRVR